MISIRRQLTRELLGVMLLLLCGGFGALYFAERDSATEQFDIALQAKARAISTLTQFDGAKVHVVFSDRFMRGFEDYVARDFFQLWDADGHEVARSESVAAGTNLPHRVGTLEHPVQWDFTLPNGRPTRAIGFAFEARVSRNGPRKTVHLVVASDRKELDESLWELLALCLVIGALLVAAMLWFIPRVLRRGLASLEELGRQTARIHADSLATRFAIEQFPPELRPIAERLNDLLKRLEDSFERERRFSADLAHELRTPLAELRSLAECAIKWPESREPGLDRENLAIAQQMERIVTHILALARGEQGQLPVKLEPIALHEVVADTWESFAPRAARRHLVVELDLPPAEGEMDAGLLRSILTNLFENAVEYTAPEGLIRVALRSEANGLVLTVANTAIDLTPEDVSRLFDRFWRKESSRSGGQHLGLGLSLSRAFANAMQWRLSARLENRQLAFDLTGPGHLRADFRGAEAVTRAALSS